MVPGYSYKVSEFFRNLRMALPMGLNRVTFQDAMLILIQHCHFCSGKIADNHQLKLQKAKKKD